MKKITTLLVLFVFKITAQTLVSDFESFTLATNSFYKDTNSLPFTSHHGSFMYQWTKGSFPYWSGGFSYTNVHDSSTKSYTNLYGVKALNGYNNSQKFVVGKDQGVIRITVPQTTVTGFYVTNTTYAFHSMKDGDSFTRKFGDTLGTGSNTSMPQGSWPDFFKLTVRGYKNGVFKNDSVEYFLADYRPTNNANDYILKDWQWVNTTLLGEVDSLKFFMYTSVNNQFGALTPLFFAMDDFTTISVPTSGVDISEMEGSVGVFPNPFSDRLYVGSENVRSVRVMNALGAIVFQREEAFQFLDLGFLEKGNYWLELEVGGTITHQKIIKD